MKISAQFGRVDGDLMVGILRAFYGIHPAIGGCDGWDRRWNSDAWVGGGVKEKERTEWSGVWR